MELYNLFNRTIFEIDSLEEYYLRQNNSLKNIAEEEYKINKYGCAIYKHICAKIHNEDNPRCLNENEKNFIDKEFIQLSEIGDGKGIEYRLRNSAEYEGKYELDPIKAERRVRGIFDRDDILKQSTIILLIIRFESAISKLYRELLEQFPQLYLSKNTISYDKIVSLDSDLDKIMELFLDEEVDKFMHKPLSEWYTTFENNHKLNFLFGQDFDSFKELYYRRNIIVHNQGIVNDTYIKGVDGKTNYKVGERVKIDSNYILNSMNVTRIILFKSFFGFVKICDDKSTLLECMHNVGFRYMLESKWNVSKSFFALLMKCNFINNKEDLFYNRINYFISVKNENGIDKMKNEMDEEDDSTLRNRFQVAKPALLDDFSRITQILEKTIGIEISVKELQTWPLFIQYRESQEYKIFVEKHEDLFSVSKVETKDVDCLSKIYTRDF